MPIVEAMQMSLDCVELVSVRDIHEDMPKLDDWQLLVRLRAHEKQWDGLITCDNSMLNEAPAMAALKRTGLTLVIADGQGHHPIRATGLILFHLDHICAQSVQYRPQIWNLRSAQKPPETPEIYLGKIAAQARITVEELLARHAGDSS
jgi:hypothetical protein